jgi:ribosomal protein S18 acetylase RimI-like enzyme
VFHVRHFDLQNNGELILLYIFTKVWEPLRSRLLNASTNEDKTRIENEMICQLEDGFKKEIDPDGLFVAETQGKIIGFSRFHKGFYEVEKENSSTSYVSSQRIGWIGGMAVSPSYRRIGVGSAMLQAGLTYLEKQGIEKIRVMTTVPGFYKKYKFKAQMKLTNLGSDMLLMEKSL